MSMQGAAPSKKLSTRQLPIEAAASSVFFRGPSYATIMIAKPTPTAAGNQVVG